MKTTAARYPSVAAWWYEPVRRFRLDGAPDGDGALDVFVEGPGSLDLESVARELSTQLGGATVRVRPYGGGLDEGRRCFRLLSRARETNTAPEQVGRLDSKGGIP
ncbi:MAG TPA: hypothetical protein VE987_10300 [Polyangiaceae bacterium]|nr:hypothetical protein [Polyangiaceae bacterium]